MDALTGQDILITGGAGFIGGHLAAHLAPTNDVTVLDDLSAGDRTTVPADATFINADLRDYEQLSKLVAAADIVFHQAALVSVAASIDDPLSGHSRNVEATLRALEAARNTTTRVVIASSAALYGPPKTVPIGEDHAKTPQSPYGLDKLTIDRYAQLYHDLYGVETVALRYFNAYGPGQTGDYAGVISVFIEQARNDEPLTVHGDGTQTRDFVHVDDIVQANLRAAQTDAVGEAYNIGTGTETEIRTLAEIIQELTGTAAPVTHTDPREGDIKRSCADITKAKRQLGYKPTVELSEGLQELI